MNKITIPYHRSSPKNVVLSAEDVIIELYEGYLELSVRAIEEVPVSYDDDMLGMKEQLKEGSSLILKSAICAVDTGYDSKAECYDVTIYCTAASYGYNCRTKEKALEVYAALRGWLVG